MNEIQAPAKNPVTVYTNQRVAIGRDLVFGWVVLTLRDGAEQASWEPMSSLTLLELRQLQRQADRCPSFPHEFHTDLAGLLAAPVHGMSVSELPPTGALH